MRNERVTIEFDYIRDDGDDDYNNNDDAITGFSKVIDENEYKLRVRVPG
jgi:hypothetical protein